MFSFDVMVKRLRGVEGLMKPFNHLYDIKQAVDDGATVPISYESRLVKIKLDDRTTKALDDEINEIADATEDQIENYNY